jgi:hypothetical protein
MKKNSFNIPMKILVQLFSFLTLVSYGQVTKADSIKPKPERFQILSQSTFSFGKDNRICGLKKTLDGNYCLHTVVQADYFSHTENHPEDVDYFITFSPEGDTLQSKSVSFQYNFADYAELLDCFYAVCIDVNTMGGQTTNYLNKYDKNWKLQWSKKIDSPKYPDGNSILTLTDKNELLLISDEIRSIKKQNVQGVSVKKFNLAGKNIFNKFYFKNRLNNPIAITKTLDNNFLLTTESGTTDSTNIWLLKFNQNGDTLWTKEYKEFFAGETLELKDSSLLFYGGDYYSPTEKSGSVHFIKIIKTDKNGNLIWRKTLKENYWEVGGNVVEIANGHYLFSATIEPIQGKGTFAYIFEFTEDGRDISDAQFLRPSGIHSTPILTQRSNQLIMFSEKNVYRKIDDRSYSVILVTKLTE